MTEKYEKAQEEIQKCHEQIARQANINHAQAKQIEDMGKQLDGVAAKQKEIHEKTKLTLQEKQAEIDAAEMEINRIKRVLEKKDQDITHFDT
jgi:predicted RNase H-like nuclease (RuvC/YqgF family)